MQSIRKAVFVIAALVGACSNQEVPVGSETGLCYGNNTCNEGLTCYSTVCVNATEASTQEQEELERAQNELRDLHERLEAEETKSARLQRYYDAHETTLTPAPSYFDLSALADNSNSPDDGISPDDSVSPSEDEGAQSRRMQLNEFCLDNPSAPKCMLE